MHPGLPGHMAPRPHPATTFLLPVAGHLFSLLSLNGNLTPSVSLSPFVFLSLSLSYLNDSLLSVSPGSHSAVLLTRRPPCTSSLSLCLSLPLLVSVSLLCAFSCAVSAFLSIISLTPSICSQAPWEVGVGSRTGREASCRLAENGPIKATRLLWQPNEEEAKIAPGGSNWKDK